MKPEQQEIERLRRELARMKAERDILKRMGRPVGKGFVKDGMMVCINVSGLKAEALAKMDIRAGCSCGFPSHGNDRRHEELRFGRTAQESAMTIPAQACLMRIYSQERARGEHRALFEEIVTRARDTGLAGATVLRGPVGFGASSVIHNAGILDLSSNLPLVIELVDAEDKLRAFLADLPRRDEIGLVTLEKVEVLHQAAG